MEIIGLIIFFGIIGFIGYLFFAVIGWCIKQIQDPDAGYVNKGIATMLMKHQLDKDKKRNNRR